MVVKPKKKCATKKTRPLAMTYILGSFFGAFMIASAFAYFNFKFSEYKFIDFSKITFFSDRKLFTPKHNKYIMVIYSTKATPDIRSLIHNNKYPVLAIDINQKQLKNTTNLIYLRSGINNILQVIQRFNIYTLPSAFLIKKNNNVLYKQNSAINILKM